MEAAPLFNASITGEMVERERQTSSSADRDLESRLGRCVNAILFGLEGSNFPEGPLSEAQVISNALKAGDRQRVLRSVHDHLRRSIPSGSEIPNPKLVADATRNISAINNPELIEGHMPVVVDLWTKFATGLASVPFSQRNPEQSFTCTNVLGNFILNHSAKLSFVTVMGNEAAIEALLDCNDREFRGVAEALGMHVPGLGATIANRRLEIVRYTATTSHLSSPIDTNLRDAVKGLPLRSRLEFFSHLQGTIVEDPRDDTDRAPQFIRETLARAFAETIGSCLRFVTEKIHSRDARDVVAALHIVAALPVNTGMTQREVIMDALEAISTTKTFGLHDKVFIDAVASAARNPTDLLLLDSYAPTRANNSVPESILHWYHSACLRALSRFRAGPSQA